jgi:hypothetical protein
MEPASSAYWTALGTQFRESTHTFGMRQTRHPVDPNADWITDSQPISDHREPHCVEMTKTNAFGAVGFATGIVSKQRKLLKIRSLESQQSQLPQGSNPLVNTGS